MGLVLTAVFGFVVWIVLWALGVKPFDAFLITILLVVSAAVARIAEPYVRDRLRP